MRPSRFLGYDHDSLGLHFVNIGCYSLARSELDRAVWLNPYTHSFLFHLCLCLYREGRYTEALQRINELRGKEPENEDSLELLALVRARIQDAGAST